MESNQADKTKIHTTQPSIRRKLVKTTTFYHMGTTPESMRVKHSTHVEQIEDKAKTSGQDIGTSR